MFIIFTSQGEGREKERTSIRFVTVRRDETRWGIVQTLIRHCQGASTSTIGNYSAYNSYRQSDMEREFHEEREGVRARGMAMRERVLLVMGPM